MKTLESSFDCAQRAGNRKLADVIRVQLGIARGLQAADAEIYSNAAAAEFHAHSAPQGILA